MTLNQLYRSLVERFHKTIEPTSAVSDPLHRQQIRLLNSVIVIFIPIAILTGITQMLIDPGPLVILEDPALLMVSLAIVELSTAYWVGRRMGYQWAIFIILVAGYSLIVINGIIDEPYHIDISYILLLSVIASSLVSLRALLALASLQIFTTILYYTVFSYDLEIAIKITSFIIVATVLIVIMEYYRNRLEDERRQKLAESEAFLRLITDQLPVSVWITDEKLSRRATFGRIQNIDQLATIPNNIALKAYYQAIGGKSAQFEEYKDNRHFQYHVEPMRNEANKIIGTLGVATDITAQKEAQQQSLQLELEHGRVEMLSKFIEHSSHDLRTPLSNINTYLYLLDKAVQSDKEHGYIQIIREQSDRLQELINNMLTLQRLELESDSKLSNVSLKSLLDEVETSVRSRIEAKQLSFEYTAPQGDILLKINEDHLHIALLKIIDNAIQFTPAGGTISLLTKCTTEQSICISIQDTGIGISEEQIPHIFEIFYRGDESRPASAGDNGLGLAIADRIVKAHKGRISVESIVNEGSTFHITLPISTAKRANYHHS